jgi:hypothetical protein
VDEVAELLRAKVEEPGYGQHIATICILPQRIR